MRRVLSQKCELGLLDPDWSPDPELAGAGGSAAGGTVLDDRESRSLARDIARQSIVLLANQGALPLAPGQRIAVVGPRAHEASAMLGCYSFPQHVVVHHPGVPLGIEVPTVLDALRADPAGYTVSYAQGCPVLGGDDTGLAEAAAAASAADVCVAVLGDLAGLFGRGTSGEGCDVADLRLPGRQEELLEALLATGTPVVLVLLAGRPYDLSRQADRLAAAVCGFYPGEEGAAALADVLSGRVNPSGRLPVSFPGAGSNQPATYLAAPLGQRTQVSTIDPTPLFPFGHGLSYAPVTWVSVRSCSPPQWPADGCCQFTVTLRNDATVPAAEVIQVYLHDPVAEVARPVQQLIAAAKVDLPPGSSRTVQFTVHADLTCYTGRGWPPAGRPRPGGAAGRPVEHGYRDHAQIHSHRPAPGGGFRPGAASGRSRCCPPTDRPRGPYAPRSSPGRTAPVPARRARSPRTSTSSGPASWPPRPHTTPSRCSPPCRRRSSTRTSST